MKVCVIGSGAREHALAHALGRSAEVVVTPGNAGVPASTPVPPDELDADLFVVGPEDPLAAGLADRLRAQGKRVFGPGADGARLESSKRWMKELLAEAGVATARWGTFGADEVDAAVAFLDTLDGAWVVKADGLAAGKGVLVTADRREAEDDVRAKLAGTAFGDAGRRVVIEEAMTGPELSLLAVTDGTRAVALAPAQDFKRVGDGDRGPNTGGMGAYSPVPVAGPDVVDAVMGGAVEPTLAALRRRGIDFRGVLYAGLMLTDDGPKIVEYNVRFGDPEAQVVLPRFAGDLADLLAAAADGDLRRAGQPAFVEDAAVCVVCATEGYPVRPRTGDPIDGLDAAGAVEGVTIYCAGVDRGGDGRLRTAGGRVIAVTALGPGIAAARERAYDAVSRISWPGMHHRGDIAASAARAEAGTVRR
jgi:phosphoribosylamine--glycine ligase